MKQFWPNFRRITQQIFLPFASVVLIDQVTKSWAMHSNSVSWLLNSGIIGGRFSQEPALIKMLFVFGIFFILSSIFVLLQFLFLNTEKWLSLLASFLFSAFCSNLIDKFRLGGVIDFIPVQFSAGTTYVFNVADFIQQITIVILFFYLIKNREKIWPIINHRRTWLIDYHFQVASALFTSIFSFTIGISITILSYLFFISYEGHPNFTIWASIMMVFISCIVVVTFASSVIYFNRAAGPVYAANRFIQKLAKGEAGELKFRKSDFFKSLEANLNKLADKLKS